MTVLENNNFYLGNTHYVQTEGVAIGSLLGRNFARCYLRKWAEKLMMADKIPAFYKRFIDDSFGIWTGNVKELEELAAYANKIHQNSKVELRYSRERIESLDT